MPGLIRNILSRIVLLTVFAMSLNMATTEKASATHAAAADIWYSWAGGNFYVFRVYFYRDCAGINAPSQVTLRLQSNSCGYNIPLTLIHPGGVEVPPICNLGTSTCNGGSVFGVQEYLYYLPAGIYQLPANCSDWTFWWSTCCRNWVINNIQNPGSQSQYFFATLDNLNFPSNNSMRFNEKPLPFRCTDAPFGMDMAGTDLDSDSMVYQLVTPQTSAGSYVSWLSGYTNTTPIPSSPAMTFDQNTGQAFIWPTFQGQYVMAVRATEYRNGVQVGSVQRDMQVNLVPCPCLFPLPVEMISFKGRNLGSYNLLEWSTASEIDNDYFMVQRSFDGEHFETIGRIEGAGNSTEQVDYTWTDYINTDKDMAYYRLEQVDYDGNSTHSEVISVRNYILKNAVEIFPVPFREQLNISFPTDDPANYIVSLRNNVGVLVRQWRVKKPRGAFIETFDVDDDHGFYIVEVQAPDGVTSFKVFSAAEDHGR